MNHRLARPLALLSAAGILLGVAAIKEGGDPEPSLSFDAADKAKLDAMRQERRSRVAAAVRERRLPPVALAMLPLDDRVDPDILPHPNGDGDWKDVIHVDGEGRRGRTLSWDLDQSGRIERDEREVTERELYLAIRLDSRPSRRQAPATPTAPS